MTILDNIAKYKREEIAQAKARLPQLGLEETAKAIDAPRGFREALLKAKKGRPLRPHRGNQESQPFQGPYPRGLRSIAARPRI